MTRLPDASVATALGWKRGSGRGYDGGTWHPTKRGPNCARRTLPAFTTSLDAITREIEARGLDWLVQTDDSGEGHGYFAEIVNANTTSTGKTAALALATALVEFLERRGKL